MDFNALEPGLEPGVPVLATAWTREEGSVDPEGATRALVEAARREGARIEYPCEVTGIVLRSGELRQVETSRGPLEADALVIAAGVDTTGLAAVAGGISEALVATAMGLFVAVPAVWMYNYFTTKIDSFVVEMDNSSSELIDYFLKQRSDN